MLISAKRAINETIVITSRRLNGSAKYVRVLHCLSLMHQPLPITLTTATLISINSSSLSVLIHNTGGILQPIYEFVLIKRVNSNITVSLWNLLIKKTDWNITVSLRTCVDQEGKFKCYSRSTNLCWSRGQIQILLTVYERVLNRTNSNSVDLRISVDEEDKFSVNKNL